MSARPFTSILAPAGLIVLATFLLHSLAVFRPLLLQDDIQILMRSVTWGATWDNLWAPSNEHVMPLGRLTTWLQIQLAGRPTRIPYVVGAQGVAALLVGLGLLYLFVRREMGRSLPALIAMAIFGVTSIYQQAVFWFAASFAVLTLDTLLLVLLAAQQWRHTRRGVWMAAASVGCLAAPMWFASGILAGPLCCLYLLLPASGEQDELRSSRKLDMALALAPLLGTLLFLAISLPLAARHIMHLEHYGDKTAAESFQPLVGLQYTARSLVDNLFLGAWGVSGVVLPVAVVVALLLALGIAAAWHLRGRADRRLAALGFGMILSSYLLIYSARAEWDYAGVMTTPRFGRYHLLPQLGLALILVAGLARWQQEPGSALTPRQRHWLAVGVLMLFLIQLPRAVIIHWPAESDLEQHLALLRNDPRRWVLAAGEEWREDRMRAEQQAVLREIERTDALCREQRIAGFTARAVLGWLVIPYCAPTENGWNLLRGSDDPLPRSEEDIRRLLQIKDGAERHDSR